MRVHADPYGIAKHAFELDLRAAKHMFGLDFIIFRRAPAPAPAPVAAIRTPVRAGRRTRCVYGPSPGRDTCRRPHNVYGPRQNIADKFRNVIGIFMNQMMRNEPVTIFGCAWLPPPTDGLGGTLARCAGRASSGAPPIAHACRSDGEQKRAFSYIDDVVRPPGLHLASCAANTSQSLPAPTDSCI